MNALDRIQQRVEAVATRAGEIAARNPRKLTTAVVATLTWTETAPTRKTASVAVPGSARLYELRVRKSGGGASDYDLFSSVSLTPRS